MTQAKKRENWLQRRVTVLTKGEAGGLTAEEYTPQEQRSGAAATNSTVAWAHPFERGQRPVLTGPRNTT